MSRIQNTRLRAEAGSSTVPPAVARWRRLRKIIIVALLLIGCASLSPRLREEATRNRERLNGVHVGQTTSEVRAIMGKEPERRDVRRRFDGKTIEMWGFATDYVRKLDTVITFVDGRVEEIKTLPWYEPD